MEAGLRQLGEKGLIRQVLSRFATTARPEHIDDCIVIDLNRVTGLTGLPYLVYSVDHPGRIDRPMPNGFEWRFYGRWAAGCTANDVLAMGAAPRGFALDLALPDDFPVDRITDFYQGVTEVLTEYGAVLEGGNVDANTQFDSVGMCWGLVAPEGIIRRRGARVGDHIAVTTELGVGWSSHLLRKRGLYPRLSERARAELDAYNLFPVAPHKPILESVQRQPGALTSGMDLTDGVVEFLYTIGESSGLGAVIEESSLPTTATLAESAALLGIPPAYLAVEYGFDTPRVHGYTVATDRWEAVSAIFAAHGSPLHRIGRVVADRAVCWEATDGRIVEMPRLWDDHYLRENAVARWIDAISSLAGKPLVLAG